LDTTNPFMARIPKQFTWPWPNHEELAKTSKQLNRNYYPSYSSDRVNYI